MNSRRGLLPLSGIVLVLLAATSALATHAGAAPPSQPVAANELVRLGEFDLADPNEARVGAEAALEMGRKQEFGRQGKPEVALVRSRGSSSDIVPIVEGSLVWVFHWGQLGEADVDGIPGSDGKPQETVFVRDDYFLLVDAGTGDVIAGVRL